MTSTDLGGGGVKVTLAAVTPGQNNDVRGVDGATNDVFGVGAYALAVTLDDELKPAVTEERIDAVLRGPYRALGQHDLRYLFEDPAYLVNADGGTDELAGSATRLAVPAGQLADALRVPGQPGRPGRRGHVRRPHPGLDPPGSPHRDGLGAGRDRPAAGRAGDPPGPATRWPSTSWPTGAAGTPSR